MGMRRTIITLLALSTLTMLCQVLTAHAEAQTAVYSTLVFVNRDTSIATQNDYLTSAGIGFGLYREGYQIGHVSTGLDFRGTYSANDKFGLGGVRAELLTKSELVRPYVEFLVGGGTFANINGTAITHLFYEPVVGLDVPMGRIDYRLLEFGMGRTPLNNTTGASYTAGNLWEDTFASGVVYRF